MSLRNKPCSRIEQQDPWEPSTPHDKEEKEDAPTNLCHHYINDHFYDRK